MPTYVSLFNFTDQGARAAKETTKRLRAFAQSVEAAGGRFIGGWWLLGAYDGVIIFQTPDGETATRLALAVGMLGNVRTTTMEAFGEEEMARIVQKLP